MPPGAELRGADRLVRTLHDAAHDLENLDEAERQAGELLATKGAKASPRRSGRLANAHGYTVVQGVLTVVAATPYAAIVHALKPWLTRTIDNSTDQVADIYLTGVDDALSRVKGT